MENTSLVEGFFLWGTDQNNPTRSGFGFDIIQEDGKFVLVLLYGDFANRDLTRVTLGSFESFSDAEKELQRQLNLDLYSQFSYAFIEEAEYFGWDHDEDVEVVHETIVREKRTENNVNRAKKTQPQDEKPTQEEPQDPPKDLPNTERVKEEKAQQEKPRDESKEPTLVEDIERWIPSLFEPAKKGIAQLKGDLEKDITEDNWISRAAATTFLDVLDTTIAFTEGIPLGLLDTRNIGKGAAKGTVDGVLEDVSRALNVIPQGKVLRLVDLGISARQVVKAAEGGDYKTAAMTAGLSAAGATPAKVALKKGMGLGLKRSKAKSRKLKRKTDPKKTKVYKDLEKQGIIKEIEMKGEQHAYGRFQKSVTGKAKEYRIKLKDGSILEADGIAVGPNGKLVLQEAKLSFATDPKKSGHLYDPQSKVKQLKKYTQATKDYPDHISRVEVAYNARTAGEIFKNIVEQRLTFWEIAKIDFVHRPFGPQT